MTSITKLALAAGLAAALASSAPAPRQIRTLADGAGATAQYCAPPEDDNAIAHRIYCRHSG